MHDDQKKAMRFSIRQQIVTGMIDSIAAGSCSDRKEVAIKMERDRGATLVRGFWL